MKIELKFLHNKLSTKTKTIVLVLGIFVLLSLVFIYLRFLDTKNFIIDSQNFYADRVKSVYTESVKRTSVFYTNRGYANLNSFGIINALENRDEKKLAELSKFRWKVLKQENKYLKNMIFYSDSGELLTFLGEKPDLQILPQKIDKKNSHNGFWVKESFSYKVFIPSPKKGFLVFSIDPKYFLAEIIKLTGFKGFIQLKNFPTLYLNDFEEQNDKLFLEYLRQREKQDNHAKRSIIGNDLYIIHQIGAQAYGDISKIETVFFQNITSGQKRLYRAIYESIFIVLMLGVIASIALHYGFEVLIRRLEETNTKLKEQEEELKQLNSNLEIRVEEETKKRLINEQEAKEKERMLIHQSKLASMGEMIGNIAHQWRQPLTQLSTILIGLELFQEKGKLSKQRLEEKIKEAGEQISFMSDTIDDFRSFFAPRKEKNPFNIQECIEKVLSLMHASLKNNNIGYSLKAKGNLKVLGYENEIAQVLINIFSNAKDVLLEREIANPTIQIDVYKVDDYITIEVQDNAGGIHTSPIEKIFEPYVSTKHASSGTGIGLYMSKTIIEKNLKGYLSVKNGKKGAIFSITLPV